MGAAAPLSKWSPADDLILKNALEGGATLESLSKGAVRFSRRYTVQELQDRWHSILYDPIVSEEASDLMFEHERSLKTQEKSNKIDGTKDNSSLLGKRKAESVRTLYYAMRKRISNAFQEGDEHLDMNFFAAGPGHTNYGDQSEHHFADYILPDSCHQRCADTTFELTTHAPSDLFGGALPASANHMTSAPSVFDGHGLPLDPGDLGENTVLSQEGISTPILPIVDCAGNEDYINVTLGSSHDVDKIHALPTSVLHPNANLTERMPSLGPETETAGIIAELDQFMECTDPENPPETVDEFYIDSLSTLLVDYPDEHEGATEGYPGLTLPINPDFPEPRNGVICCKLNTEDPVIPDNDDVFLPVCMPTPSLSCLADWEFDKAHNPVSASIMDIPTHQISSRGGLLTMKREQSDKDNNHLSSHRTSSTFLTHQKIRNEGPLMMKKDQIDNEMFRVMNSSVPAPQYSNQVVLMQREETENNQPHISSHIMGSSLQPVIDSNHAVNVHDGNHNLKHIDSQSDMLRNEIANKQINQLNCTNVNQNNSLGVYTKEKVIYEYEAEHQNDPVGASLEGEVKGHNHICGSSSVVDASKPKDEISSVLHIEVFSNEELDTSKVIANELEKDPELLGNEEWLDDDDVPYFSDVEAMILDMDFSANDEDNDLSETVSQHPNEKLIRTTLRLEQAARASSHRMMQAHGAFAVLYSHYSRHLIKKPEVLLGRTAVDYEVDIDLSKERCRNKISRRQAIIKVISDGTFNLKNLGKVPIYVNGREVAPRQCEALTPSCLIEIRKAVFLFETNPARVAQYIEEENLRSKMEQEPVALE